MWKQIAGAGLILAAMMGTAGCGTKTSVTQVWQAQMPPTAPMTHVLVIAMKTDEPMRRTIEDRFASDLAKHGVNAVQSYKFFGDGQHPPVEEAKKRVEAAHFDGLLVTRLHGVKEEPKYMEQTGYWDGYYMYGWGYRDAYIVADEIVTFENSLWDTRAGSKMVWTAETQTHDPVSGYDFADSLSRAVDPALTKGNFIPPKR